MVCVLRFETAGSVRSIKIDDGENRFPSHVPIACCGPNMHIQIIHLQWTQHHFPHSFRTCTPTPTYTHARMRSSHARTGIPDWRTQVLIRCVLCCVCVHVCVCVCVCCVCGAVRYIRWCLAPFVVTTGFVRAIESSMSHSVSLSSSFFLLI